MGIIDWLQKHMIPCFSKKYLGIECPGCGLQRSFIALFKGNIVESLKFNASLIPMILLFTFLVIHLLFKLKNGAKILQTLQIITGSIMIIQFVVKQYFLLTQLH